MAKKQNKANANPTKRFVFIVILIIFIPLALYLLAVRKNLAFFIMAAATLIIIQVLNWVFKER